jgi:predicted site-specific integrase-resolvase
VRERPILGRVDTHEHDQLGIEALIPVKVAQQKLGVSLGTMWRYINRGDIATVRVGGRVMIEPSALRAYIDARRERRGASCE